MIACRVASVWNDPNRIWICFDEHGSVEVKAKDVNEAREKAEAIRRKQGK